MRDGDARLEHLLGEHALHRADSRVRDQLDVRRRGEDGAVDRIAAPSG